jgi:hypothetical protein
MKAKTVKEALIAVEWMLENIGWCQNDYYQDKEGNGIPPYNVHDFGPQLVGSMCLKGAIDLVVADPHVRDALYIQLHGTINCKMKNMSICQFNDLPSTCKEDILGLVKQAIRRA